MGQKESVNGYQRENAFQTCLQEVTMNTIRRFQIALISLLSIFVFSLGWASSSGRTFVLDPTAKHLDASGTAVIADDHINIQVQGLKPEAVYTVWFVNM
jgi:hypothetical protein